MAASQRQRCPRSVSCRQTFLRAERSFTMQRFAFVAVAVGILASCGGPSTAPTNSQPIAPPIAKPSTSGLATAQQRALVIAGGGPLGRAWELGLLKGLKAAGIDL